VFHVSDIRFIRTYCTQNSYMEELPHTHHSDILHFLCVTLKWIKGAPHLKYVRYFSLHLPNRLICAIKLWLINSLQEMKDKHVSWLLMIQWNPYLRFFLGSSGLENKTQENSQWRILNTGNIFFETLKLNINSGKMLSSETHLVVCYLILFLCMIIRDLLAGG